MCPNVVLMEFGLMGIGEGRPSERFLSDGLSFLYAKFTV